MNLHIDSQDFGRYTALAAAKSVAGFDSLKSSTAHNRASGFFTRIAQAHPNYGGLCGGIERCAGICGSRSVNPAQFTTSCLTAARGDYLNNSTEAAIMATIPTLSQPEITLISGRAVTSSLAVAAYFTKRHDNIIQKIQTLECSSQFIALNFKAVDYTDAKGEIRPCYEITRSGFMFLAMGFTGKKAAHLKESYINAFDAMEARLSSPALPGHYQVILTFENNVMVDSRPVRSDEYTCCMATFFEMAERQGYLVIHADDLKSLTFGNRKRGDS